MSKTEQENVNQSNDKREIVTRVEAAKPGSFWRKEHPLMLVLTELVRLVPQTGRAATTHGELLRGAVNLYYDRYNNGLCNADTFKVSHALAMLQSWKLEILDRCSDPGSLSSLFNAIAEHIRTESMYVADAWAADAALEDVMEAVVRVVCEAEYGQDPSTISGESFRSFRLNGCHYLAVPVYRAGKYRGCEVVDSAGNFYGHWSSPTAFVTSKPLGLRVDTGYVIKIQKKKGR